MRPVERLTVGLAGRKNDFFCFDSVKNVFGLLSPSIALLRQSKVTRFAVALKSRLAIKSVKLRSNHTILCFPLCLMDLKTQPRRVCILRDLRGYDNVIARAACTTCQA